MNKKSSPAFIKAEYKKNDQCTYFEFFGNRHDLLCLSVSIVKKLHDEYGLNVDNFCFLAKQVCSADFPETKEKVANIFDFDKRKK